MTVILIEFMIVLIGLAATAVLFYRFPVLSGPKKDESVYPAVSVIIPARNEESNLTLLLTDLRAQTLMACEIIVVDDESVDATADIALSYGAKLISVHGKPEGWTGKTWACQQGAAAAKGELLLFLDADVRLGKDGLRKLIQAYAEKRCTVSVQPFHRTEKPYEQFSLMFNLVQIAGNGAALPKPLDIGLYGPVILISKQDYAKAGGHEAVRKSVVEDMALGRQLKTAGLPYRLFVGEEDIAFRMYGDGFKSLLQGWIKNIATGAARTPGAVFLMVFFWIASLTSVPLQIIKFSVFANIPWLLVYSALYIVWAGLLALISRKVGRYQPWVFVCFPILMVVLLGVFAVSGFKKLFGCKVTWKGRAVETGDNVCE